MIEPLSLAQARNSAIAYLSRREHACLELRNKLLKKGFAAKVIDKVLIQLQANNLLSDERFVESYVRIRINKGFGPLRIQQELQERGISGELLNGLIDDAWVRRARTARQKRFGQELPRGKRELGKQIRFLQYRGFTTSQIQGALSTES